MLNEKEFLIELAAEFSRLETIILRRLSLLENAATGFRFFQVKDFHQRERETMITGAAPGASCRIVETPVPAGGQLQSGSSLVWSTSDPLVVLTPSADGSSVVCAIDAANKNSAFPLHLDGVASDGSKISGDVTAPGVPIQQPVTVIPATGFSFDQAPV